MDRRQTADSDSAFRLMSASSVCSVYMKTSSYHQHISLMPMTYRCTDTPSSHVIPVMVLIKDSNHFGLNQHNESFTEWTKNLLNLSERITFVIVKSLNECQMTSVKKCVKYQTCYFWKALKKYSCKNAKKSMNLQNWMLELQVAVLQRSV